ncbi:hypothetical protein LOTGIDRAFT_172704 [Lottia gigantea]|uniref:Metalloendopeptidase n=1 Tax=Lottia gigantea TaxID=225164 RepID=V4B1J7_LOTGI|nr:hypothetical protein LOTGIDRAFT_172704 [Lottia gigantea]ESP01181.1 hypothetical protein LOTGIDRAFT_172704 [Lottia gigantea]
MAWRIVTIILNMLIVGICCLEEPEGDISIDEIIRNASTGSVIDNRNGDVIVEYDLVLSLDEYEAHYGNINYKDNTIISPRKAVKSDHGGLLWPNGVIPYEIASNTFSYQQRSYIEYAIADWERYTCLHFRKANYNDKRKVVFSNGNGCWSNIGMTRNYGPQYVYLAPNCRYKSIILHEIGHALGFFHEHTRPDRDDFVYIQEENVMYNQLYNFRKNTWYVTDSHGVPYDYTSIMHYSDTAFSRNGASTIVTKNRNYQSRIGKYRQLSFRDIKAANKMYQCKPNWCKYTDYNCPGEGFIGKDCKCWCVGTPYKQCGLINVYPPTTTTLRPTTTTVRPTTAGNCVDKYSLCNYWSTFGRCTSSLFVKNNCKKSCNSCSVTTPPPPPVIICADSGKHCEYWSNAGFCQITKYKWFLIKNCMRSCGLCNSLAREGKCQDNDIECPKLASKGDCENNSEYMEASCRKSCNMCSPN